MQVATYGIELSLLSGAISFDELFDWISATGHFEITVNKVRRRLHAAKRDGLWHLLVVTIRDSRRYLQMEEEGGSIEISELAGNRRMLEMNLAVFDPATGHGAYQHYKDSLGHVSFFYVLHSAAQTLAKELAQSMPDDLDDAASRDRKEALESCGISGAVVVKRGSIESLLADFEEVKWVECRFAGTKDSLPRAAPMSAFAKRWTHRVRFTIDSDDRQGLLGWLRQMFNVPARKGMVVGGKKVGGADERVPIHNPKIAFSTCDFDDLVAGVRKIELSQLASLSMYPDLAELLPAIREAAGA